MYKKKENVDWSWGLDTKHWNDKMTPPNCKQLLNFYSIKSISAVRIENSEYSVKYSNIILISNEHSHWLDMEQVQMNREK